MRQLDERLPRGRHGLSREAVVSSQRRRLEAAAVEVIAARGFDTATVADLLEVAGVGRETFYELFDDKRDCMLAVHAGLVDELEACLRDAYLGEAPWPRRARDSVAAALEFFAARPAAARFMLIELFAIGPPARERFHEGYNRFVALFEEGLDDETRESAGPVDPARLAVGAVAARTYEEVLLGRATDLPRLTDALTYELVVPFLGEEAARAAATAR